MPTELSKFVNSKFKPSRPIPRSCIEGTEYLIQSIRNKTISLGWSEGGTNTPNVIAEFGGKVTFNITTQANFQNSSMCGSLTNYKFKSGEPEVGQGIILLRKGSKDAGKGSYNMHLGAVVARSGSKVFISDVSEVGNVEMTMDWEVSELDYLDQFRYPDYPDSEYAMGLLRPEY